MPGTERVETGSGGEAVVTDPAGKDGLAEAFPVQTERKEQS